MHCTVLWVTSQHQQHSDPIGFPNDFRISGKINNALSLTFYYILRVKGNNSRPLMHFVAELALKARAEIADYIRAGKEDRARIRVSTF